MAFCVWPQREGTSSRVAALLPAAAASAGGGGGRGATAWWAHPEAAKPRPGLQRWCMWAQEEEEDQHSVLDPKQDQWG